MGFVVMLDPQGMYPDGVWRRLLVNPQVMESVQALGVALALGVAAVLLFWPVRGLLWRWLRGRRATEKVLTEDALKHIFDCEYKARVANLQSLSGVLAASGSRAAEILQRLEERELITGVEGGYRLTSDGRRYALRVIRSHRLWERYLSDHTGLDPDAWHDEAEFREHETSPEEADALSARLGHPRYDPHGDPIPTAGGEIIAPLGKPLNELPIGELAEIVHVEDEPAAIYAQLVAEGLHPGMRVRVSEASPQRIRFEADAEEHVLAPVFAANLSVQVLPREEDMPGPYERLSGLGVGESATVIGLSPQLRGPARRRMLDLGLIPGTVVSAEIRSPSGDPVGYRIRGAVIALRCDQADQVRVERRSTEQVVAS
ncbi:MAG: FeoA domain-containing protein [Acidobacteriota bacterium]|nr:FeoA domain-containing protein [Acidobacteriota bacterium]